LSIVSTCRQFDKEEWKSQSDPTEQQLRDLRLNGWKNARGKQFGPNFFDWFQQKVILLSICQYVYIE